ncbi:MAG: hypothetical protein RIQ88_863, partial [Actinomycetota bacterium]
MQRISKLFSTWRNARIERILSHPARGFIIKPRFRRFLCVMAVLFSYIYLAFLIIPRQDCLTSSCTPVENPTTQQWALLIVVMIFYTLAFYAPAVMLASFLLLRRSMSRVTSLPDEYLDEREIANRDWAFKTGYLVVRRVGLALALLFLVLRIIGYAPGYGQFVKDSDTVLFVKQFNNYLLSLTGN